ncbi:hypothetical protein [Nesterenkonia sp. K-15-9-6]|uniref:hypothetical protein n=1 Tax=Nesterenkonia sp. K-15-9-6 TaxID=3093918 RepID=UPI004043BD69
MIQSEVRLQRAEVSSFPSFDEDEPHGAQMRIDVVPVRQDESTEDSAVLVLAHLVLNYPDAFAQVAASLFVAHDGDLDNEDELLLWVQEKGATKLYEAMTTHVRAQAPYFRVEFDIPADTPRPEMTLREPLAIDEDDQ